MIIVILEINLGKFRIDIEKLRAWH